MITILGAGGAVGSELVKQLARTNARVRLVGRNPKLAAAAAEMVTADVSDLDQTVRAVSGIGCRALARGPQVRLCGLA